MNCDVLQSSKGETVLPPNDLIDVAEASVLKVCEILKHVVLGLSGGTLLLSISLLVSPDEQKSKGASNANLGSNATNDESAAGLVDGSLLSEETVGSDDVSNTVSQEDEGRRGSALGVATDVGSRHLESDDEAADERGTLEDVSIRQSW